MLLGVSLYIFLTACQCRALCSCCPADRHQVRWADLPGKRDAGRGVAWRGGAWREATQGERGRRCRYPVRSNDGNDIVSTSRIDTRAISRASERHRIDKRLFDQPPHCFSCTELYRTRLLASRLTAHSSAAINLFSARIAVDIISERIGPRASGPINCIA